ncbi:MAG: glucokinase, partial [Pseudomonadota bacterium]
MARSWFLLADIGGTNARFALGDAGTGEICEILTVSVADHPTFTSALQTYLAHVENAERWEPLPIDCCLAVASPAERKVVTFTNSDWVIHRDDVAFSLQL